MKTQAIVLSDVEATPQNVRMGNQPGPIITIDPVMVPVYIAGGLALGECGGYPTEDNVRLGIDYGQFEGQYTGNVELPLEADVKNTVQYGANGTEYTGTYSGGGGGAARPIGSPIVRRVNL